MKIFLSEQIKIIDNYTIENEPVSSSDLMERAALMVFEWMIRHFDRSTRFIIFAGPGNNGGDALVLARFLDAAGYTSEVHYVHFTEKVSPDFEINRQRLATGGYKFFNSLDSKDQFPVIWPDDVVIDGIFGSGLTRAPEGLASEVIKLINRADGTIISIDIPSGLFGEDNSGHNTGSIVGASITLTFQFPRLSFMFADNFAFTGDWHILPIGLHPDALRDFPTPYYYTQPGDIASQLKERGKFDHKGNYGHGLLLAGSKSKTGAAILSAKASLRTGIGLITCHVPSGSCAILQTSLPEAMIRPDNNEDFISQADITDEFNAIGAGPGIGTGVETQKAIYDLLRNCDKPIVIDADALNILSLNKDWLKLIRPDTILTPHPKEFERLAGKFSSGYARLMGQIAFSKEHKCIVVLKGANTSVTFPDGTVHFNSTGNPGMATAGSGDVLTGIILSLLAQRYTPADAAVTGVYLHGLAGDIAAETLGYDSLIASDIIDNIANGYDRIRNRQVV
jgi:ADP-dependent NAD(P)H-hydrate dehydratase / NAD(P)H-hydrate epimerase